MKKISSMVTPPNGVADISMVQSIKKLHKRIYQIGTKLGKRDKLGIHAHIENRVLTLLGDTLRASFAHGEEKQVMLEQVRVNIEVLKHLLRTEYELIIITEVAYLETVTLLVEISKMTNGWIKYLTRNPASKRDTLC